MRMGQPEARVALATEQRMGHAVTRREHMLGKKNAWFAKPVDLARHCLAQAH